jgi:hypothetical protein
MGSEDLWGDISMAIFVVVPLFWSVRALRDRVVWIREAEDAKGTVRRALRATLVTLVHLAALYLYYRLLWWIATQHPEGFR